MLVAVNYRFHDYEPESFVIDTEKLKTDHKFESDLKTALENEESYVQLDGELYNDDWGNIDNAKTGKFPIMIDRLKNIHVFCGNRCKRRSHHV